ncbi:MAG: hypothetical protein ACREQ4_02715 [Candidatus Binataceae bacterium]
MRIHNHLGTEFRIWNRQSTWFWHLADRGCDSSTIGAAATEMQAIGEARTSIEESRSRSGDSMVLLTIAMRHAQPTWHTRVLVAAGWERSFTRLAQHLAHRASA